MWNPGPPPPQKKTHKFLDTENRLMAARAWGVEGG